MNLHAVRRHRFRRPIKSLTLSMAKLEVLAGSIQGGRRQEANGQQRFGSNACTRSLLPLVKIQQKSSQRRWPKLWAAARSVVA